MLVVLIGIVLAMGNETFCYTLYIPDISKLVTRGKTVYATIHGSCCDLLVFL